MCFRGLIPKMRLNSRLSRRSYRPLRFLLRSQIAASRYSTTQTLVSPVAFDVLQRNRIKGIGEALTGERTGQTGSGAVGAKGGGRGEREPAKHAPGTGPGTRGTGAGARTAWEVRANQPATAIERWNIAPQARPAGHGVNASPANQVPSAEVAWLNMSSS